VKASPADITAVSETLHGLTKFQRRHGTEGHRWVIEWLQPELEHLEKEARIRFTETGIKSD